MKTFAAPFIEIERLAVQDILTASGETVEEPIVNPDATEPGLPLPEDYF